MSKRYHFFLQFFPGFSQNCSLLLSIFSARDDYGMNDREDERSGAQGCAAGSHQEDKNNEIDLFWILREGQTRRHDRPARKPPFLTALGASRTRYYHSLLRWFPKLDLIAIWIFKPCKVPVGIFGGLFDCHALALKVAEDFSHVLH